MKQCAFTSFQVFAILTIAASAGKTVVLQFYESLNYKNVLGQQEWSH